MKDMDAMVLAVMRQRLREGRKPKRDVVLAFTADEEAGGKWGARYLTQEHPGLFEGVTEAIGEVGGVDVTVGDQRLYALQTAEKGLAWMRLTATGTAGHGSMIHGDNAVTEVAEAVAGIGRHEWPVQLPDSTRAFLTAASAALGVEFDPQDPGSVLGKLGGMSRMIGAAMKNTTNPTGLKAGYKVNVIPQSATAEVDGRFVRPRRRILRRGRPDARHRGQARVHPSRHLARDHGGRGPVRRNVASLLAEDPQAKVAPYCLSAGTDAKWFASSASGASGSARFSPPELDFSGMFHGVDERVAVDGLRFGVRVLDRFLDLA